MAKIIQYNEGYPKKDDEREVYVVSATFIVDSGNKYYMDLGEIEYSRLDAYEGDEAEKLNQEMAVICENYNQKDIAGEQELDTVTELDGKSVDGDNPETIVVVDVVEEGDAPSDEIPPVDEDAGGKL